MKEDMQYRCPHCGVYGEEALTTDHRADCPWLDAYTARAKEALAALTLPAVTPPKEEPTVTTTQVQEHPHAMTSKKKPANAAEAKQKMTTKQAASMAARLQKESNNREDIAAALAAHGYRSYKTGKPLTVNAVSALLTREGTRPAQPQKAAKKTGKARIDAGGSRGKNEAAAAPQKRRRRAKRARVADSAANMALSSTLGTIRTILGLSALSADMKLHAIEEVLGS
jgi:hypothetical protein